MEYKILYQKIAPDEDGPALFIDDLQRRVNSHIREGWIPLGHLTTTLHRGNLLLLQAMQKREKEDD
jgi:hypothetical protein